MFVVVLAAARDAKFEIFVLPVSNESASYVTWIIQVPLVFPINGRAQNAEVKVVVLPVPNLHKFHSQT